MNHLDWCTHVQFEGDNDILTRELFDVNMRLFHKNKEYKELVLLCCDYIKKCASTTKDGYKTPHGWSGANAGIPFNIIAFKDKEEIITWINPKIIGQSKETKTVLTNCGSLTLEKPIRVTRSATIDVSFYDLSGNYTEWKNIPGSPGYTIEHEILHNRGILLW